ncbi:alpha/beta hydrolase [Paenibacillus silvae]|uniref:Alpha/beta hydrolase n=1 Tax=Paenibacillus silvae TaxID=1325358 RepID=A0ABQ1ZEW4_9BACL|nr:alpha/beta hydrolase [Paenibacillus silvae]GGH62544.1 alpha/beta hydrolase [Paenibacillus silvae]
MIIPIQINSNNKFIMGMLHMPMIRSKGSPIVIICNGLGGTRADVNRIGIEAGRIAEQCGVMVFRFDYTGQGQSGGDFWDVTIDGRVGDVLEIIHFFKGCFNTEEHKIILLGFSDGAKVVIRASESTEDVNALILWSPVFFNLFQEANSENDTINISKTRIVRHPKSQKLVYPFQGLWMNSQYLKELKEEETLDILHNSTIPKICVLGSDDEFLNNFMIQEIERLITKNSGSEVFHVKGANHVFSKKKWAKEVIDVTLNWIVEFSMNNLDNNIRE